MVTAKKTQQPETAPPRVLVVGNYCHDVLIQNGSVVAESLGGAASFISNVLNGMSINCHLVSKVGYDFKYNTFHAPIVMPTSKTTVFKAYFDSGTDENCHKDRVLKRVCACDPIMPSDLPDERFDFGMVVGVGGEILPQTIEKMIDICCSVFIDIQALIRVFDDANDGTVNMVGLKDSGFYHLLPRITVLKVSSEEALVMDLEEVRKWCCVVVTSGKDGCNLYWRDGELQILPFAANQVDPTGAGDSFLGGLVAGLFHDLSLPDAALMGNFFGSLTVEQIGLPKLDLRLLQMARDEVHKRKDQTINSIDSRRDEKLKFVKAAGHEQFHASLSASKRLSICVDDKCHRDVPNSQKQPSKIVATDNLTC
ncbi:inositol 3-kinase-like [Rutidosis leptorrhynchoides]|uniref:inositol 3-kinase-like n=1 Tax=Rutidosis leptorrhynchoides TaxID=125765 RepID=UPI003A98D691